MKKEAEILSRYDEALANSYVEKTGRSREDILKMMDKETWLTADRAVELGFIDSITQSAATRTNTVAGMKVTDDMLAQFKAYKAELEKKAAMKAEILNGLDRFGARKDKK